MTEAEWLACTDTRRMRAFLRDKASDRKVRRFACACCRRIWPLISDPWGREAVEVAERYADGAASEEELGRAWDACCRFDLSGGAFRAAGGPVSRPVQVR